MTTNDDAWNKWRRELNEKLRRVYDALPEPLKTTYRKGEALKSFDSFVESFNCLLNRDNNHPRIMIAESPDWELWMHLSVSRDYPGGRRPDGEPLYLESVSRRDYEEFGDVVERIALMRYLDIIGESDFQTALLWWRMSVGPRPPNV